MPELIESVDVPFEGGPRIRALRYDDASVRFRLHDAGPMTLEEAFLTGQGKHVIIKLAPRDDNDNVVVWEDGTLSLEPDWSK